MGKSYILKFEGKEKITAELITAEEEKKSKVGLHQLRESSVYD